MRTARASLIARPLRAKASIMGASASRSSPATRAFLDGAKIPGVSDGCKGAPIPEGLKGLPIVADESVMSQKAHGTSEHAVMKNLRYGSDRELADRICNFNRHYAEHAGYAWSTNWISEVKDKGEVTYYDSVTGAPLFIAPRGRTWAEFEKESRAHGWPSFRDAEMVQENVRCLRDGECVSTTGTHLGHNLPDRNGNRYCINLVSVAGNPEPER
ncbi:predicted protein [Ostreococcus lucimarinus CCE9901]|jgi:peptide methionine sulfoxide reductase MsrB|uniref:MsrB domain-containing protein n=1 Tax=Ostreococcus lucimarinus (strain CCE9901) TaxID=436017 RepID=A4RX03_OSTLU|nr:predicted protein [Ostreococcus lucimarinus CCE9901]ABO96205.1 predicted protein [Ostreococcus lucimarinus CCE9901]|tara:strand:- start:7087 stop:7728 length:642 start_codon:yes stop_codon:yes gene_type:complete|eukprot:XP_001417912.1 predicted protein [Ostreococcus lucimarinus CCE9901]